MHNQTLDILIIGAAQAGLAMGHALLDSSLRYQLLEDHSRIGDVWRNRYDSLLLFTPRSLSSLPGLPLRGDQDGYAGKDEFADYLESYAAYFNLPVRLSSGVRELRRENGHFQAVTSRGESVEARTVVLATGGFQNPSVPRFAKDFSSNVLQLTTGTYKNPSQIPAGKTVLVVGDGASGRDFASELVAEHPVYLATGKTRKLLPQRILGRPSLDWLNRLGALQAPPTTLVGRYLKMSDSFPDRGQGLDKLRSQGIHIVPKLVKAEDRTATFADGSSAAVEAVVWAIGYRDHSAWVCIPEVKDDQGNFVHDQGISPVPGLFLIGRPWQRSRGSAFIGGVGHDARFIKTHLENSLRRGGKSSS